MQKAAELLYVLGDHIDAIKSHIIRMDDLTLNALFTSLPSKAPAGTAEMVMLLLVHREMESRSTRRQVNNVLPFHTAQADRH
ncbi:hypothetical protein [Mesorhizobium sp. NZP2077]|uniref:hypothetical protein n=1 Tax=Mesorhizobium sp. NZP2077 TaxID=2483404 RepID=UPI001557F86D|nr:hypothetical protein [Mesorhizobium sp. NZP2077]QKC85484.1 hypothetical protein EB232_31540 [Mesorhizobium sp. NZP2077]QKD19121.1 hypothetical protein HGP13_31235 [Mesorhizobium sp. NZP2077]